MVRSVKGDWPQGELLRKTEWCSVLLWCGWKCSCGLSTVHVTLRICVPFKETLACHANKGEALMPPTVQHGEVHSFLDDKHQTFLLLLLHSTVLSDWWCFGFLWDFDLPSIKANTILCNLMPNAVFRWGPEISDVTNNRTTTITKTLVIRVLLMITV